MGGPADWLVDVRSVDELQARARRRARDASVPVTVLGGGSNVLVADDGVRGVVVRLQLTGIAQPAPDAVRAEAGVTINGLVRWTIGRGLAGLEAWAGTPGTVGGAIYGNAHYGGREHRRPRARASMARHAGGDVVDGRRPRDMAFAYDTSRLQRTRRDSRVGGVRGVARATPTTLRAIARASLAFRKRTQPLALPSAGLHVPESGSGARSVPAGMPASAGALIDRAGLKGAAVGGARISHARTPTSSSTKAARPRATSARSSSGARRAVRERFGVELRDEVVFLGSSF